MYCRLFDHRSLTPERLFIFAPSQSAAFVPFPARWRKTFTRSRLGISADARYQRPAVASDWQNKSRDIHYIIRHLTETLGQKTSPKVIYRWRTNCFTVISRLAGGQTNNAFRHIAIFIAIHQTDDGELFIDTCLTTTAKRALFLALRVLILWFMRRCPSAGRVVTGNSAR